jgi:hypothetical protein
MWDLTVAMTEETSAALTSDSGTDSAGSSAWYLGSRAALQCARRAHNDFDPTLSALELKEIPPNRWAEQGLEFEIRVVELIKDLNRSDVVDLRNRAQPEAITATTAAMAERTAVVIGGALPDHAGSHRTGRPDLLVYVGDRDDGRAGYAPVEIKSHRVTKESSRGGAQISPLGNLTGGVQAQTSADLQAASTYRQRDLMQLSHYWRMLEACGLDADVAPMAGIIGSDTCTGDDGFIIWQSLTDPLFDTYSRSRGTAKRSALERYDHEFEFRIDVVNVALKQDQPDAPAPLVRPIWIEECESCPWHDVCLEDLGDSDPSVHVTSGRLSVREWNALRRIGIESVDDLSSIDTDDSRLEDYWPELEISASRARSRLEKAVIRAQMSLAGEDLRWLENTVDPIPRADVEVDFDLEWDGDNRIYLWGLLVTEDGVSRSESLFSWERLEGGAEEELATSHLERMSLLTELGDSHSESRGQA